jgi:hypothetical protein
MDSSTVRQAGSVGSPATDQQWACVILPGELGELDESDCQSGPIERPLCLALGAVVACSPTLIWVLVAIVLGLTGKAMIPPTGWVRMIGG